MHRILLIDDDELLAPPLAAYLQRFDMQLRQRHAPERSGWRGCGPSPTTPPSWT